MKQLFLKRNGNPRLLLCFAGWGADEHLFNRPVAEGYDYLLCFDYRTPDFDTTLLKDYREIDVLAWSMGVWVAGCVLAGTDLPLARKVAVNGTPFPIDDQRGIPCDLFEGTLQGFSEKTLVRFRRRMCGSLEQVRAFLSYAPYRPVEELKEELAALKGFVLSGNGTEFCWDKAILGTQDRIFPIENQRRAWMDTATEERDVAHYDDRLFDALIAGEEDVWTRH